MDHFVYIPEAHSLDVYPVSSEEHHHLRNVLRAENGDELFVLNGKGIHFLAIIESIDKRSSYIRTTSILKQEEQGKDYLHLAVAPTKNIDRFEFLLEKAVEIGVDRITPVLCARSERRQIRTDRMEKIVISAMKQSHALFKAELDELTPLQDLKSDAEIKAIAHCMSDSDRQYLRDLEMRSSLLLIGPEGDFSPEELEWALEQGFSPISLGEKRLRTETAAIFGLSVIHHLRQSHD